MNTTFDGDFNALRSPDTAPRDAVVLGFFEGMMTATLVAWDHHWGQWVGATLHEYVNEDSAKVGRFFCNICLDEKRLTGWLPLPRIEHVSVRVEVNAAAD